MFNFILQSAKENYIVSSDNGKGGLVYDLRFEDEDDWDPVEIINRGDGEPVMGTYINPDDGYTISYKYSNNKSVGTAKVTVTIKFKNNYSGTITKTKSFTIRPKKTSIKKLSRGRKSFTVKWKKQSTQTSGYQIRYSTSKSMKNAKTVTVSGNKKTSKKITKLKKRKSYYVQVRTYKTVNGKKYASSWSSKKKVKTK